MAIVIGVAPFIGAIAITGVTRSTGVIATTIGTGDPLVGTVAGGGNSLSLTWPNLTCIDKGQRPLKPLNTPLPER